jgi:hypothetical protein
VFDILTSSFKEDVLVAVEGSQTRAFGTIVRIAPGCSAIANFRIGKSDESTSEKLLGALVDRARGLGSSYVSCIPGRDLQPSDNVLLRTGFEKHGLRSIFTGATRTDFEGEIGTLTDPEKIMSKVKGNEQSLFLAIYFRPVPLNLIATDYLLSHGACISVGKSAAFVTISQALTDETRMAFLPEYVVKRFPNSETVRVGEISLLDPDPEARIVHGALKWLALRGVGVATVYSHNDLALNTKIHSLGLDPLSSQLIWQQSLVGPLDFFSSAAIS